MGELRFRTSVPLASSVVLDLAPFDRFGGRGGRVSVKCTVVAAEVVDTTISVLVGSDVLANAVRPSTAAVDTAPDNETPAIVGFGAPADPITITLTNTDAALARVFFTNVSVENA